MRHMTWLVVLIPLFGAGCRQAPARIEPETIMAMERAALDRWGKGDPDGYFEIMARDETYFDPTGAKRVDGEEALRPLIAPFRGKIRIDRYEMIDPRVQGDDHVAVLTFNLISRGAQVNAGKKGDVRWNATEVYQRIDGRWKIVHSHWSYTKPELKEQPAE